VVGECRSNVSSPGKVVGKWRANVSSPAKRRKWPFWRVLEFAKLANFRRVLEFDKFAGEWPLLKFVSITKSTYICNYLQDSLKLIHIYVCFDLFFPFQASVDFSENKAEISASKFVRIPTIESLNVEIQITPNLLYETSTRADGFISRRLQLCQFSKIVNLKKLRTGLDIVRRR
jgi:hypothetical protein